ncbi:MAG: excinuclease ABC subunit UvrC [Candidatus Omnitrophica bacterium]|nr:excinuclease ABC subunit UvrC [Candidatus Omnitrophota bacterium]
MDLRDQVSQLPDTPGVYLFKDAGGSVLYVGKALSLKKRVASYFHSSRGFSPRMAKLVQQVRSLETVRCVSEAEALIYENSLIKEHQPKYNVTFRDDKTYPMLKITHEPYPRLMVTRKKQEDGAGYYGPFVEAGLMHQAVKMMRKIFPLRTCQTFPKRPCLEYYIGQCLAPCAGYIDEAKYNELVREQRLFLDGQRAQLLKALGEKMRSAAQEQAFEEAARVRDQIYALSSILLPKRRVIVTDALEALKELLRLPTVPSRIEAFDISNIHGKEAVGSMVTFVDGKPFKDHYRKFKIQTVVGIDDYRMMREVIHRRYAGSLATELPLPHLILIDGGKGHLSSAVEELQELKLDHLAVMGIAKEYEHLFLRGRPNPLILPPSSPILHLLQRLRDEAHRFAITYHRQLHRKTFRRSWLDRIRGLGPRKKADLLAAFSSVEAIQKAAKEELMQVRGIGEREAALITRAGRGGRP